MEPLKSLKIRIPGKEVDSNPKDNTETLSIEKTYVISSATRSEAVPSEPEELDDQKVIEFTYDDKTVWIGDFTTIDEILPGTSDQVRSVASGDKDVVDIPVELTVGEQNRSGIVQKVVLTIVKIFTKKAVSPVVKELAAKLEAHQLGGEPGLYWFQESKTEPKPLELVDINTKPFAPDGRYLLFLHGTASSTLGSFDKLQGTQVWKDIAQTFGGNVLAFQHESLTKSPLENVASLIDQLPPKATLTLISHSRGGLVGDILNRFFPGGSSPQGFSTKEKDFLRKNDHLGDIAQIEAIEKAIQGKDITIEKFIRVACTASGTTLASKRLDIYVNVIFNIIGVAAGQAGNPVYIAFKDLISALIEQKDNTNVLPGLEVQNPLSPFNQMLNNAAPETIIDTPLVVISGDAELSLQWKAIKVALSNVFFLGDNDFVVDTRSMYNGAKRKEGNVQYFFDESPDVSHFDYFKNVKTQDALQRALQTPAGVPIPSFTKLDIRAFTKEEIRSIDLSLPGGRVFQDTVSGNKPIVLLLPGIMGSTLTVGSEQVWINFFGFVSGSLTSLVYNDKNNLNVRANGLVGSSYRKLTEFLKRDYDVVTFPFDWRSDMATNAATLNQKILDLMKFQQPIKLIGHSMGGVLIRDFMLNHDKTWQSLKATRDFRLLFLGAPLGGSFRIPYVLFGLDSLINTLDLIDITNSQKDLLAVFSQFPGILSLLPLTTSQDKKEYDFADPATWKAMRKAFDDEDWPIPADEVLNGFGKYRDNVLAKAASINFDQAAYIAGQSRRGNQTISGYQITQKGSRSELEFLATKEGDESVTWASGIPKSMNPDNVYYSDVPHGELANDPKLFSAISDLLRTGATSQLKRTRPTVRALDQEFKAKRTFDFNLSPEGVEETLMGLGTDSRFAPSVVPVTVSVSNGDLKYAMYPVMAGHFENDGILFAEKAIDWYLNGELKRRYQLGLYPGPFRTSDVIIANTDKGSKGALILGLGRQGQLTEYRLTTAVEQGTSSYLATLNNRFIKQPINIPAKTPQRIGISSLLVGSGYGGLRIENVVRAIIQGVQNANAKVQQIYNSPRLIDTIEFIELYKDRALACVKAISAVEKEESRSLNIIRESNGIKKLTGLRERLPIDDTTEWWTRITVRQKPDSEDTVNSQLGKLQFTISTDAARLEERPLQTINATLTDMLEDMSQKDNWSPELAKAIFELMIPNDFKDQVKRQSNINWLLDKYTAGFPWELLQDSVGNARPLSVNAGMIRQLETGDFRQNITPVTESTAIVIGDPDLKKPAMQLPAARAEGDKVADLLSGRGFDVTKLLGSSAADILRNLFSRNYKIVHLAGHGVFNSDPKKPTGMVIGPDAFLTPSFIDQMSNVPELVFVNCCFLGQTDGLAEQFSRSRFQLAANIGTQLIEIGVKAVVVAGWAVNDRAALDFAERFYQYMFDGDSFGDAVKKARKTIFENYGATNNTWGAYQCYGDPFYKLQDDLRKPKIVYDFSIPEEAEIELGNLLEKVRSGNYDSEETLQAINAINDSLKRASISSSRIIELEALLYSGLNKYEQAIGQFKELWKQEKAAFSFSATEQYCNTQAKWHVQQVKENGNKNPQVVTNATDTIKNVIADLESLMRFGQTVERINLLGSTYKRLALISKGTAKRKAYKESASFYQQSYATPDNKTKFYPLTNWLLIENALVLAKLRKWGEKIEIPTPAYCLPEDTNAAITLLNTELTALESKKDEEKEFWDWIAVATILLAKALLGDTNVTYEMIYSQYVSAWGVIGTGGQRQAEIENLDFLLDVLALVDPVKVKDALAIVNRLKTDLLVLV